MPRAAETSGPRGWNAEVAVSEKLYSGEVPLWTGTPSATRGLDRQDVRFIVVSTYLAITYWAVAFFAVTASGNSFLRLIIPFFEISFFVVVRPAIRHFHRRRTVFAITPSRALAIQGGPLPRWESTELPRSFQMWRREDGRGSIVFDSSKPSMPPSVTRSIRIVGTFVLFVIGFASRPFPSAHSRESGIVFYEVPDVQRAVDALVELGAVETMVEGKVPRRVSDRWSAVAQRRLTPSWRVVGALLGVILMLVTIPVIAVRGRDYLQNSPTVHNHGVKVLTLQPGTYVVFEHTVRAQSHDCYPIWLCVTISSSNVSVRGTSGSRIVVVADTRHEGMTDRQSHYAGAVQFDIRRRGTYVVTIHSDARASFVIALAPSEEIRALGGWIAGAIVGVLVVAITLAGSLATRGRRGVRTSRAKSVT